MPPVVVSASKLVTWVSIASAPVPTPVAALWALWPLWVWFCVVATANHYLLDVFAGIGVAVFALAATAWLPRLFERVRAAGPVIANLL